MSLSPRSASLGSGAAWLAWRHLGFLKKRKKRAGIRPSYSVCSPAFSSPPLGPSRHLRPFEGWWQALRLTPAVVYGGLAYAFLVKGFGRDRGAPPDDEGSMTGVGCSLLGQALSAARNQQQAWFRPIPVIRFISECACY
jgi:hypothetical protein